MGGKRSRLTKQRLVPFEAARHVAYSYNRPRSPHRVIVNMISVTEHEPGALGAGGLLAPHQSDAAPDRPTNPAHVSSATRVPQAGVIPPARLTPIMNTSRMRKSRALNTRPRVRVSVCSCSMVSVSVKAGAAPSPLMNAAAANTANRLE